MAAVAGRALFLRALGSDSDVAQGGKVETSALDGLPSALREELEALKEIGMKWLVVRSKLRAALGGDEEQVERVRKWYCTMDPVLRGVLMEMHRRKVSWMIAQSQLGGQLEKLEKRDKGRLAKVQSWYETGADADKDEDDHEEGKAAEPSVVIDMGSHRTSVGFGGGDGPRDTFRTAYAIYRHADPGSPHYEVVGDRAFDPERRAARGRVQLPVQRGMVCDWDAAEKIWRHAFTTLRRSSEVRRRGG